MAAISSSVRMTSSATLIPLSSCAEWESALEGVSHAFAHSWQSCHAMSMTSGAPTFLFHWAAGSSRFVCPVMEREFEGYVDVCTPYGFSGFAGTGDWIAMQEAWRKLAVQRGYVCGYIGLNPLLTATEHFPANELHEYSDVYVLDLRRSEADLYAALTANRKRQLKSAEAKATGLDVSPEACRTFLSDHLDAFYDQRGVGSAYRLTRETLESLMNPAHSVITGAEDDAGVVAASLFVHSSYIAEYFAGISTPAGRRWSAVLLWRGAMELMRRGIPFLNLGGGVRRGDGVAEFKSRFGAERHPLCALKQVYRPDEYTRLCASVGTDPEARDGFFPAYHQARNGPVRC
jgi:hypothetical protein